MERLSKTRMLAGFGLLAIGFTTGCKSTRPEVPPGRGYSADGRQLPPVGFSSDPHPLPGNALGPTLNDGPASTGQLGTPGPGAGALYGAPTNNTYGPPGSAPLGLPPSSLPAGAGQPTSVEPMARPPMTTTPGGPTLPPIGETSPPQGMPPSR